MVAPPRRRPTRARSADVGQDDGMAGSIPRRTSAVRSLRAMALAMALALGTSLGGTAPPAAAAPLGQAAVVPGIQVTALPRWTGGVNLYRRGVYTMQKSWLWCTAASIQIIRNIVRGTADHMAKNQRRYFNWMREHNRYRLPLSAGVDAQGWAAGFRHYVDGRYRLVASKTFASALRLAVIRLRKTNLPVGVTVSRGNHAWVLHGFTATADPATTANFRVTSVRVTGPLYGRQSRNGYDMKPNKKLTVAQFKRFFTPWRYAPKRMIWDGRFISIQPVTPKPAASTATTKAAADPAIGAASVVLARLSVGPSLAAAVPAKTSIDRRRRRRRPGTRRPRSRRARSR
jgi:hypothetical protein